MRRTFKPHVYFQSYSKFQDLVFWPGLGEGEKREGAVKRTADYHNEYESLKYEKSPATTTDKPISPTIHPPIILILVCGKVMPEYILMVQVNEYIYYIADVTTGLRVNGNRLSNFNNNKKKNNRMHSTTDYILIILS